MQSGTQFAKGLTTTYTTTVKRTYYKAALLPSELNQNSFSEAFRAAALNVARNPNATIAKAFIFEFGNFILDTGEALRLASQARAPSVRATGSIIYVTHPLVTCIFMTDLASPRADGRAWRGSNAGRDAVPHPVHAEGRDRELDQPGEAGEEVQR